jgi:hypothetical protein
MSKVIDKAIRKRSCNWICTDQRIYRRDCKSILCGYYYDNAQTAYNIGTFKTPLFQEWAPHMLDLPESVHHPYGRLLKPAKPDEVAIAIEGAIAADAERGFEEVGIEEYVRIISAIFESGTGPFRIRQGRAYALILLNHFEQAKTELCKMMEVYLDDMDARVQNETNEMIWALEKFPEDGKNLLHRTINLNKKILGLS